MATIVLHIKTGTHYILIGTSYSYYKDSRPSVFGGSLFPHEEEGEIELAAVCNENGGILWIPVGELKVLVVDNESPDKILEKYNAGNEIKKDEPENEECPACGQMVSIKDIECPYCGLTLILET